MADSCGFPGDGTPGTPGTHENKQGVRENDAGPVPLSSGPDPEVDARLARLNPAAHIELTGSPNGAVEVAARQPDGSRPAPNWSEAEQERAAIGEYDGNVPRAWAEGFARLDPDRPPGYVPPARWRQFIDDIAHFLDSPFCATAASLGWGPHDLFGCDANRPFARIDCAGLLWLLNGERLVALSQDAATIETRTGMKQIFRRRPSDSSHAVLAWELSPK
jgi:hypothetical protein